MVEKLRIGPILELPVMRTLSLIYIVRSSKSTERMEQDKALSTRRHAHLTRTSPHEKRAEQIHALHASFHSERRNFYEQVQLTLSRQWHAGAILC